MQRIKLNSNIEFSRLIYGMWRIGDDDNTTAAHVEKKIQLCLDQGITTFDQADIYGGYTAEAILGAALKKNPSLRQRMEIVTKCDIVAPVGRYSDRKVKYYDTTRAHIEASVNQSLKDMQIDSIDLLLIHRPDPLMDHNETGEALDDLVKSGKVRSVGVSNFKFWDWNLLQSAMTNELVTNQIEVNLNTHHALTDGSIAFLQERGIKPMAWSPLAGGSLVDENNAELTGVRKALKKMATEQGVGVDAVAVSWLLKHPATILPILGTNNLQRIATLSDALKVEMSREDWFVLYESALGCEVA